MTTTASREKRAKAPDAARGTTAATGGVKAELHQLVDALPEGEVHAARRFLEYLRDAGDPVLRAFMEAPEDDEPLTEEEIAAIKEGEEEIARGEGIPWERVRAEVGLDKRRRAR